MKRLFTALLLAPLLVGCPPSGPDDTGHDTGPVYTGPLLAHTVPANVTEASELELVVTALDDDGVAEVKGFYRHIGDPVWESRVLELVGDDTYQMNLSGAPLAAPGVEYYFRAEDDAEFTSVSYLPEDGQQGPFQIPTQVTGNPLPWTEDFEGAGAGAAVNQLGWDETSEAFAGYPWELTNARFWSGARAVRHRRGISGVGAMVDWLVSPPLDFSGQADVQVTWYEWGNYTSFASHELFLSTGSPDPADGDFVSVAALAAPLEDRWGRSAAVDLTAWAGEPLVYLAWQYEGGFADDWYLDDVAVGPLTPDLTLTDVQIDDGGDLHPGDTVPVTFTVVNRTTKSAVDLTFAPAASTDAPLVLTSPSGPVTLEGLGTQVVQGQLSIDAGYPDNTWVPYGLTATSGTEFWSWDLEAIVGELSKAHIELQTSELGLLQVWLGVGDPADPEIELAAFSEVAAAGTKTYEVDLSSQAALLPPGPADRRWYLRVLSEKSGTLTSFRIDHDGSDYVSEDLGAFVADVDQIYYLPRPAVPVVLSSTSVPDPVSPGVSGVQWTVELKNTGKATTGATTLAMTSVDPDVTVVDIQPSTLGDATGWAEDATQTVVFTLDVAGTQIDSRSLPFVITVTDELESFTTTRSLEVPWPVLNASAVRVDDGNSGNGRLDPGETAVLEVDITNGGDKATFGPVNCNAAIGGGSATATLLDSTHFGQRVDPLLTIEARYEIQVTSGSAGDELILDITCTDASQSYHFPVTLALGEPPWIPLSAIHDAPDDALGDNSFDLINGRYRSDGTTLEIILVSSTVYDFETLFLEAWLGNSPGSEGGFYQLVAQSGNGSLRTCDIYLNGRCYGFVPLEDPVITALSPTEVHIAINLGDMGLVATKIDAGFASGFCGGTDYYCDHFPDAWGDPYVNGLRTSRWLTMRWVDSVDP